MADFYPVAADVKPQDPNQAFTSMNNILGLQSKRQELQIQGQELQQKQLATQQQQGANNFFSAVPPDELHDEQGNISAEKAHQRPEYKALPGVARVAVDTQLNALQNQQLANKQALTTMNGDLVGQAARVFQSASQEKDPEKAKAIVQAFAGQSPEAQRIVGLYAPVLGKVQPQHLSNALGTVAKQALDVTSSGATSAAATGQEVSAQQAQTNPKGISNAAGQQLLQQPATGAISTPPGADPGSPLNPASSTVAGQTTRQVYGAGLAPSEQLPYVAQRASAGARATGGASSDIERGNQVSALIQPSNNGISLTKEIDDLAEQVHSGKFVASISKAAAAVGMKEDTYARQVLEKDLGRLKTLATEGAGSDARAGTILSGFPTAESDTQTLHNAMDYTRGVFKQNLARGTLLNKVKEKDPSLTGLQHADDTLTSRSDPLMHEFQSLKSPQERISFYKRHFTSPADAQEFKAKVAGMGHILGQ